MNSLEKSKRGETWVETVFVPVLQLLLVVVLLFLVMYRINAVTSQKAFDETYQARDLAMLIDTLFLSPGEVYLEYDHYQPGSRITLSNGGVSVSSMSIPLLSQQPQASFVPVRDVPLEQGTVAEPFRIEKTNRIAFVAGRTVFQKQLCDPVFIPQPKLIIVDPAYDDHGIAFAAARAFKALSFMLPNTVIQLTTSLNQRLTEQEHEDRIPTTADMVIRLVHQQSSPGDSAQASVNQNKVSYDIACDILRSFHQEKSITTIQSNQKISVPIVIALTIPIAQPEKDAQQLMEVLLSHIQRNQ